MGKLQIHYLLVFDLIQCPKSIPEVSVNLLDELYLETLYINAWNHLCINLERERQQLSPRVRTLVRVLKREFKLSPTL